MKNYAGQICNYNKVQNVTVLGKYRENIKEGKIERDIHSMR